MFFAPGQKWHLIKLFTILNTLILAACSSAPPAQVTDREQPPTRKILIHSVAPNETLYSIAWRYGLDYRQLARHNGIGAPYTIYATQQLRLDISDASKRQPPPKIARREPVKPPKVTPQKPAPKVQENANATQPPVRRSENKTTTQVAATPPATIRSPLSWRWPVSGKVIAGYSSSGGLNKGVDIGGKLGESVVAAAGGYVVYAGSGLRGYGKLVIVKHNDTYLSAYAHNRALSVKEGDTVKAGQKIAELGSSGTDKEKLHFEIRRDGKPVNPLTYLPKR
ncbi:peptidoglycan DD-metalloendopeptidase family protein [Gilvimarinus agarilyticus]|uniref:peptidoglycan DD-metalloendopeptidase family protein n=1 Tax=unclassified Gilvimarinus TaxID=2642066 RepID=UPI001C095ECA|nr:MULTISPECIES: peptidoglycan DD-metalloendopeptidase family protein [unclassified Gilvimarinus]MBU2886162.1 peptidoglycan DD-metalloendopeptidase family protein [Gilvimarinus agarilyticus]MDO6570872.1 peptidoglycan DD-metalloendopeptidase family protein [Gilvimarinus sp. 2_MG-2023]MDO6747040.1 peptidoglycan DD-metalloendopeptidase family protein [Gilvimarinus sp. 1_MG-2023]